VDLELIASIGHELQHAVEILSNPDVRSTATMYFGECFSGRRA
jgi:hypothetical protein